MSATVPVFKISQRIRVMNTSTATERGIANLRGTVTKCVGSDCEVDLDDRAVILIPSYTLNHITPEEEAKIDKYNKEHPNCSFG